ncbi:hypothetical protein [Yersinia massiliensis]|uniref:hypothetical protein n=1 Tax=Yersinia massiliensis TaxID=419257 RepID=UPI00198131BD|nr:hypothetical protein [Yersinia massiliensis]
MNNIEELKSKKPENLKSRSSVLADYVTDDNTGGYFVVECENCGEVFPSQKLGGGGAIADTGDYDDAYCPHCNAVDPDECYNAGLVWNIQQAKINALIAQLEAAQKEIHGLKMKLSDAGCLLVEWKQRVEQSDLRASTLEAELSAANEKLKNDVLVMPDGLHRDTKALLLVFASAMAVKLHKAEQKYGHSNTWMKNDWRDKCLEDFNLHIRKGDPLDVANYCAFMHYHGWPTALKAGFNRGLVEGNADAE